MIGTILKYVGVLAGGCIAGCVVMHMSDDSVLKEASTAITILRSDTTLTGEEFREKVAALKAERYADWAASMVFAMNLKLLDALFDAAL